MQFKNFLQAYKAYFEVSEVPESFALWSAITVVGSMLGRKCYIDLGFKIHPSFMTILIAGSGARKSSSFQPIRSILGELEDPVNLLPQKTTHEALIEAMLETPASPNKLFASEHTGLLLADELTAFLNHDTYRTNIADTLTSFYDCEKEWVYKTIGRGDKRLQNLFFCLLAATTPHNIQTNFPEQSLTQGIFARMLFVYVNKRRPPVAIPLSSDKLDPILTAMINHAKRIRSIKGRFDLSPEANTLYTETYNRFYEHEWHTDSYLRGYASRRMLHVLRVAMVCAAVSNFSKVITEQHMLYAIALVESLEVSLPTVVGLITTSKHGSAIDLVLATIQKKGRTTRHQLTEDLMHQVNPKDIRDIVNTLVQTGRIETLSTGRIEYLLSREFSKSLATGRGKQP